MATPPDAGRTPAAEPSDLGAPVANLNACPAHTPPPPAQGEKLSFYQRYFTKPAGADCEKAKTQNDRRFAFASRGFLIASLVMLLLLIAAVAAAVAATTLDRHRPAGPTIQNPPPAPSAGAFTTGSSSTAAAASSDNTSASTSSSPLPPIRAAIMQNFPDPDIIYSNGTWYAYATNNAAGILNQHDDQNAPDYGLSSVQIATSTDFATWSLQPSSHDPLPTIGAWAAQGLTDKAPFVPKANTWAPAVIRRPLDDKYIMYYSAVTGHGQVPGGNHPPPHCIGAAVADSPAGPFAAMNDTLACPIDAGGAIDPTGFIDADGSLHMAYKVDGNNIGHGGLCGNTVDPIVPTPIMLQKMHPDGTTPDGPPVQILDRTDQDGPLVEAPQLVRSHQGVYFLFYSSGCTRSPSYDIRYATATVLAGPYTRAQDPLIASGDWGLLAPGSVGVADDGDGGYKMAFHARVGNYQGSVRAMFTTALSFDGHKVAVMRDRNAA